MITDEDVFPRFSYMNDAGHFGGWVNDYRDIDGTAEVTITRYGMGDGIHATEREVATRPIAEGQDYREIIMEYADEQEIRASQDYADGVNAALRGEGPPEGAMFA